MSNLIFMAIGLVGGMFLCFISDRERVKLLINKGYDNAVRDIFEYGYYYDKDNNRVDLMADDDFCSYGSRSEKPNNSEIPTGSERSSE